MSNLQRPNRLKEQADEQGVTPETLVRQTLDTEGSVTGAAAKLGVAHNTIRYWVKKMGLQVETHRVTTFKQAV